MTIEKSETAKTIICPVFKYIFYRDMRKPAKKCRILSFVFLRLAPTVSWLLQPQQMNFPP